MVAVEPRHSAAAGPVSAGERSADVAIDDQVAADEWDRFVGAHPAASVYHRAGWRRVFERAFRHECVYLGARSGGTLVGILPLVVFRSMLFGRFAVSLPFVNYGGVLADDENVAQALLSQARAIAEQRKLSYVELRHLATRFPQLPAKRHKVAMWLALPTTADLLWNQLDRKVRNQIRKAEKSRLTVDSGGVELVPEFYDVFARNMRDLGTPVYGRQFFQQVFTEFPEASQLFVVRHEGRAVAAGATVRWRGSIENPWASSLREYRSLCPNMLLYWSMLRAAIESRATTFDFGRSTPNEGTFFFKQQWGAAPTPMTWEYQMLRGGETPPSLSPTSPKFRLMIEVWKRLPVQLATALGPHIVRSIP